MDFKFILDLNGAKYLMAYTKEQAREKIAALVANFRANEPSLFNVPEAQIEASYIRPLFRFLNWNVENAGLSEPQWEFVVQRTDRHGTRPDYILQLDGQHLFVMDAKMVKYEMHNPRWLNQVYAYAYSTQNNAPSKKIDFAILTDFQEFIILDCTLLARKPYSVKAFTVIDWRYDDYVNRFNELWELFERSNVLAACRERKTGIWSRYLSPKQVKANRIPPDKAFLSALDDEKTGWRVRLAKDMKKHNQELDGNVLTAAVQLLIDRLVFVKVLSDREIEDDYLAKMAETVARDGLAEEDCGWFVACQNLFGELNAMYNGSVFAPRPELEAVTVSNKVVREIIEDMLPENSPYNFSVLPVEILGTIYERFLGRVVNATAQRVKIEDKPEVRRAGGVYYTPQYIVTYIVQNTVGKLLSDCKTPADVAKIKILDPACGSGSFLLGAYEALIEWHKDYYTHRRIHPNVPTRRDSYYLDDDGRVRLTAKSKRLILLNNLFGVDIDPQAVEVTRLSLSLKALEDTRSDEAHQERTLFNQTLLPDLRINIKCGNSLIGMDYLLMSDEELRRIKPFDWNAQFAEIMHTGGFDAVIGNPPYIFSRELITESEKDYFNRTYRQTQFKINTYLLFVEKGFHLLRRTGRLGVIIPNNWLTLETASKFRHFILTETGSIQIVNSRDKVFEGASVDTSILIFSVTGQKEVSTYELANRQFVLVAQNEPNIYLNLRDYIISYESQKSAGNAILCMKILGQGIPLEGLAEVRNGIQAYTVGEGEPPQTEEMKENRVYHSLRKIDSTWIKYVDGVDVGRYYLGWSNQFVKYGPNLSRPRKRELFQGERLLVRQIPSSPPYSILTSYVTERLVNDNNSMIVLNPRPGYGIEYLMSVLNSKLMSFWFIHTFGKLQRKVFPQFKVKELRVFPIRTINFADAADKARHDRIIKLVEQMLDLHKRLHSAKTETDRELYHRQIVATDTQIDALVYELYGLTEEEIRIVDGK